MTNREWANKVWELFDKQLLSASRTYDDTWDEYHLGCRDCLATTMEELEAILPRPNRKVKKAEKRWVVSYWSDEHHRVFTAGIYDDEDRATEVGLSSHRNHTIQEIEISVEVEE